MSNVFGPGESLKVDVPTPVGTASFATNGTDFTVEVEVGPPSGGFAGGGYTQGGDGSRAGSAYVGFRVGGEVDALAGEFGMSADAKLKYEYKETVSEDGTIVKEKELSLSVGASVSDPVGDGALTIGVEKKIIGISEITTEFTNGDVVTEYDVSTDLPGVEAGPPSGAGSPSPNNGDALHDSGGGLYVVRSSTELQG